MLGILVLIDTYLLAYLNPPLTISYSGSPYWCQVYYLEGYQSHHTPGFKEVGRRASGMVG